MRNWFRVEIPMKRKVFLKKALSFMHIASTLEATNRPQGEKGEYFMAVLDENRASLKSRPPQRERG